MLRDKDNVATEVDTVTAFRNEIMSFLRLSVLLVPLLILGCSHTPSAQYSDMRASEIIAYAAANPEKGVTGNFLFSIRAVGQAGNRVFLNLQDDYRDQRNISIVLMPEVQAQLAERGLAPETLKGKQVMVRGTARRVRIAFNNDDGKPSGLYYYQTHLRLRSADDLKVVE